MQTVKVLRSFNKTPQGNLADVGETIEVEDTRAQDLQRLGLAEPVATQEKVASQPENKRVLTPDNKAGIDAADRQERRARRTVAREKRCA